MKEKSNASALLEPILVSERGAVCIRVCSHVRSRLPPRSPASAPAFAKSPAS